MRLLQSMCLLICMRFQWGIIKNNIIIIIKILFGIFSTLFINFQNTSFHLCRIWIPFCFLIENNQYFSKNLTGQRTEKYIFHKNLRKTNRIWLFETFIFVNRGRRMIYELKIQVVHFKICSEYHFYKMFS